MAFGSIELTTITRTQDYVTIKQNEDNKAFADQFNGQLQVQKNEDQRNKEVHSGDNAQWKKEGKDARDKGSNEYYGDGGKRRKKQSVDQVVVKGQGGFDMKI